ncbi:TolC family protein [Paludibaculum fermentans]|uniref:TolC family protein n=1 Tax=Paludibaculum fermentans TaxID=1473598 RepID=UPI003EBEB9C3
MRAIFQVPARLAVFPVCCVVALAQPPSNPPPPLTVADCIHKALAVPSAASVARKEREIASLEVRQARVGLLPQSEITSSYQYNSPSRLDRSTMSFVALNGIREFTALVNVIQEIDTSGRLRASLARARATRDEASASVEMAERDLRKAVAEAYYRTLLARHIEAALKTSLGESEAFEQRVNLLWKGGEAARADVVKASAQTAFLRQAADTAQLAARLANQELASFWTEDVAAFVPLADVLDDPLPLPDSGAPADAAYMRRPEFKLYDAQLHGFRADSRIAKSNLYPRLSGLFQFGVDSVSPTWQDRGYLAGGSLTIPVFDWFRSLSLARQFQARAAQVQDSRSQAQRAFSAEYESALLRVKQLFGQVEMTRQQVALSEEDRKLSQVRYEGGEGAALDVVTAENQLAQARTNLYSAIASYLTARLELEVAAGR